MAGGGGDEPNLTPFIDLFSVLICFLLMTAAWLQLDSMNTVIDKATSPENPEPVVQPPPEKKTQFSIVMKANAVTLKEDEKGVDIANTPTGLDKDTIRRMLESWKKKYPDRRDVTLNTESGVLYGKMISMYDLLIASGWPDVGINPQSQ